MKVVSNIWEVKVNKILQRVLEMALNEGAQQY